MPINLIEYWTFHYEKAIQSLLLNFLLRFVTLIRMRYSIYVRNNFKYLSRLQVQIVSNQSVFTEHILVSQPTVYYNNVTIIVVETYSSGRPMYYVVFRGGCAHSFPVSEKFTNVLAWRRDIRRRRIDRNNTRSVVRRVQDVPQYGYDNPKYIL